MMGANRLLKGVASETVYVLHQSQGIQGNNREVEVWLLGKPLRRQEPPLPSTFSRYAPSLATYLGC